MPSSIPHASRREREILEVLFRLNRPASAEEIRAELSDPPSGSAVRAMLTRLEAKGQVFRRETQFRYLYSPTVGRAAAQRGAVEQVVRVFFGGSAPAAAFALLTLGDWTDRDLERLAAEVARVCAARATLR